MVKDDLDEAIFRLRVAAYARAANLDGLIVERRDLIALLRRTDGHAAWQAVLELDRSARRREKGLFHRVRRLWLRVIGS